MNQWYKFPRILRYLVHVFKDMFLLSLEYFWDTSKSSINHIKTFNSVYYAHAKVIVVGSVLIVFNFLEEFENWLLVDEYSRIWTHFDHVDN